MKGNSQVQQWHRICNMRSTLLQVQYLYCQIAQDLQQQQQFSRRCQKDRLVQFYQLYKQTNELASSNFKILLIAKLQSLLAICAPINEAIWANLTQFIGCVNYLEEQMARDVAKLYIGGSVLIHIDKCEEQLKIIQAKIVKYLQENEPTINEHNAKIQQLRNVEKTWEDYIRQFTKQIKQKVEPHYAKYLRRRLQNKSNQLECNINALKQFIKS